MRDCSGSRRSLLSAVPGFAAGAAVAARAGASRANPQRPDQHPFGRSLEAACGDIAVDKVVVVAAVARVGLRGSSQGRICQSR